MKKISIYGQILIGMALGLAVGFWLPKIEGGSELATFYIKPFGSIFLRLLQMLAIPLVIASLITGIASIKDMAKLSSLGIKTISIFISTSILATMIGILIATVMKPGAKIPPETRAFLLSNYNAGLQENIQKTTQTDTGVLQLLVDAVPSNIIGAAGNNQQMLQVVIFALLFGMAILKVSEVLAAPVLNFFTSLNEILIKLVGLVMQLAPIGVFALMTSVLVDMTGADPSRSSEILLSLGWYTLTVFIGLACMLFIVYPLIVTLFSKTKYLDFFKGLRPAFLLAFSSSSSSATLPVTMTCVVDNLKVKKETAGFVLPLGTTINMDGTALYQCVAALFIAQVYGLDLSFGKQLVIIFTATMGAIGAAGVPGAGMITLIMVLESVGIPLEGIALILAPDRILDMCRTVINVSGDATVALLVKKKTKSDSKYI